MCVVRFSSLEMLACHICNWHITKYVNTLCPLIVPSCIINWLINPEKCQLHEYSQTYFWFSWEEKKLSACYLLN